MYNINRFTLIAIVSLVLLFLIYFDFDSAILVFIRNFLGLMIILYLSGYSLVYLLFQNKLKSSEIFVLGIGCSIALTISNAMIIYFFGFKIIFENILALVSITTLFISLLSSFKIYSLEKETGEIKSKKISYKSFENPNTFYLLIIITIVVLSVSSYFSWISPSKEEFVEVYWKIYKTEETSRSTQLSCKINNCSLSGTYKLGSINIIDKKIKVVMLDLVETGVHDSFCVDLNNNEIYCESDEGPYRKSDSFLINSDGFYILDFRENNFIIANYPKEVNVSNFNIGFVIKSYYSKTSDFNISLFTNETLLQNNVISLEPNQESFMKLPISLPNIGLFKIKLQILNLANNEEIYIDFLVNRI